MTFCRLRLLRARGEASCRPLDEAMREAEEQGFVELNEVLAEMGAIIAEEDTRRATFPGRA